MSYSRITRCDLVFALLMTSVLVSSCGFDFYMDYDSPPIEAPGDTVGGKYWGAPPSEPSDGTASLAPPPNFGMPVDDLGSIVRIQPSVLSQALSAQGVSASENSSVFSFSGSGQLELSDQVSLSVVGQTEFTITVRVKSATPNNNYKLVSSAKWNGGCNSKGFNIGTQYPEFWADTIDGSCSLVDTRTCAGQGWGGKLRANEWEHLAVSVSPSGDYKEYLNGQIVKSCQSRGVPVGDPRTIGGFGQSNFVIGAWGNSFRFNGQMTDIAFYEIQLSDDQVQDLAAQVPSP